MIGVILCVSSDVQVDVAIEMRRQLTLRFPGVEFAIVPAVHALAFDFEQADVIEIGGQTMTQAQYDAARFPLLHRDAPDVEP